MLLFLDTSDNKKALVELDGERLEMESGLGSGHPVKFRFKSELRGRGAFRRRSEFASQNVLLAIEKLLKKRGVKLSDLTEIRVKTGPGSFTGLKIGVTIANALGYLLGIPVNGREISARSIIEPEYGRLMTND